MYQLLMVTVLSFLGMVESTTAEGLIGNAGYEKGAESWTWFPSGGVRAERFIDGRVKENGRQSIRLSNKSSYEGNVFALLHQTVEGLKSDTLYRISLWCKGQGNTNENWFGGGPKWALRCKFPEGDFDWQWKFIDYRTGPKETTFQVIAGLESPVKALWVDEVTMTEVTGNEPMVLPVRVVKGLAPSLRFYPVTTSSSRHRPTVKVRSATDSAFGVDVQVSRDSDHLIFDLDVRDANVDPVVAGESLYLSDSIQMAIDTKPHEFKRSYTQSCYELGFAFLPSGSVAHYAWQTGSQSSFDFSQVKATGQRNTDGYNLQIVIPWEALSLDPAKLPSSVGVDILVNDGSKGRRFVEWTPGIGWGKRPDQYARLLLTSNTQYVILDQRDYEDTDWIQGVWAEYARMDLPAGPLTVSVVSPLEKSISLFETTLPAVLAGSTRQVQFVYPASLLKDQGEYRLVSEPGHSSEVTFSRFNISQQITLKVKEISARMDLIRRVILTTPEVKTDSYVTSGLAVAERFFPRMKNYKLNDKTQAQWALLQVAEMEEVLNHLERNIKRAQESGVIRVSRPTGDAVELRNGIFYTQTRTGDDSKTEKIRPVFLMGFCGWEELIRDFSIVRDLGFTLSDIERSPAWDMQPDGTLKEGGKILLDALDAAKVNGIKADVSVCPHGLPDWLMSSDPEISPVQGGGFVRYNIDHPRAREVLGQWITALTGAAKGRDSLFSFFISNEPVYGHSGRDTYSRPEWIAFLQKRHQNIQALNNVYQTKYASFDEVPVPAIAMPSTVELRRAYYDWCCFNQEHFARWHAWINGIVKSKIPKAYTHSKVLPHAWSQGSFQEGIDPELICGITDLAGNDSYFYYDGGAYAYQWQGQEIWYELLHSFRGQPVLDSEVHFLREVPEPVATPAACTRAMIWQGALHHRVAAEIWGWSDVQSGGLEGNITQHPANLYAAGQAALDLNRLAEPVAAVNQAKPDVALLFSMSSVFWQDDYYEAVKEIYTGLNFMGKSVTFVSERQLAGRTLPPVDAIIVPQATHVNDATVAVLAKYVQSGGKLLLAGKESLMLNEYHQRRTLPKELSKLSQMAVEKDEQHISLVMEEWLMKSGTSVTHLKDVATGKSCWGVEYRIVPWQGGMLVPLMNLLTESRTIQVPIKGTAVDLMSGEKIDLSHVTLEPMQPRMLEVKNANTR
jgi:hypothetical protein